MLVQAPFPHYLSSDSLTQIIVYALQEDVGSGDVTSQALLPENTHGQAALLIRETGVIGGLTAAQYTFHLVDPTLECTWTHSDGDHVESSMIIGVIKGSLSSILTAERVALNIMQRMSGIATATAAMIHAVKPFSAQVRDTRKTAPGLRLLDKWAVQLGGGMNHRIGLFDRILIKDNHIDVVGGLASAVELAANNFPDYPIDVEARTMREVKEALTVSTLIDVLLLDNMTSHSVDGPFDCSRLKEAVSLVAGRMKTEATGGVTLETAAQFAATGVDYLSCGALTHSVQALDIALNIDMN